MNIKNRNKKIRIEDILIPMVILGTYIYLHLSRERNYVNIKEGEFGSKRLKNIEIYKLYPEEMWKQIFFIIIAFLTYLFTISVIKKIKKDWLK